MSEAVPQKSAAILKLLNHFGQLTKWQWRSAIASLLATVTGGVGWVYQEFFAPTATEDKSWFATLSPHAGKLGLSFLIGFAITFLLRAFFKWTASILVLIALAVTALTYFNITNIDLSPVKQAADGANSWLSDQAGALSNLVTSHLPSTGGGLTGAFMGWRRKKT